MIRTQFCLPPAPSRGLLRFCRRVLLAPFLRPPQNQPQLGGPPVLLYMPPPQNGGPRTGRVLLILVLWFGHPMALGPPQPMDPQAGSSSPRPANESEVEFVKGMPEGGGIMLGDGAFDAKPVLNTLVSRGCIPIVRRSSTSRRDMERG
jgi:hypothetical protein